jgi:N-acetyl-anhydromuramyl-L-alanine amidase AmpD
MADNAPSLSDPLGPPHIVTGVDYMHALAALGYNVENMSSPLPVMSKIAQSATSLVDNQYNQALQWQKDKAGIQETVARANNIDSVTDYNNQALNYRLKGLDLENKQRQQSLDLFPLDVQAKQQTLKENEFRLQEAQRNADETDKAHGEYQAWHDELAQLDPTDPDYDNKIASIMAKYPEASTNPSTQRLIAPLIQQQNVKRSQSFVVQQRTDQLNQLRGFQQNGLIPPDTDIPKEVAAGNGQSMVNRAKQQGTINRLQSVIAYGSPGERQWAQNQINDITGANRGPNETPPPMFGPNGDLNPGSEALLSTIERRAGITPVAPGAKKETKVTTDETGTKTETTITGQPVTAQDIARPQAPAATTAMPTKPEDMQKDPVFQGVFSDLNAGKLALPGNPKPGTPEFTAGLFTEYSKRKAAAAQPPPGQATTTAPSPAPSPPPPQRASKAGRRGISEASPSPSPPVENIATAQTDTSSAGQEPAVDVAATSGYTKGRTQEPQYIVLHSSDGKESGDIEQLTKSGEVSAHYYTTEDGRVHHFVPEGDTAWHAGKTIYPSITNADTIGIEQEHIDGKEPWSDDQVRATARTVADIMRRHPNITLDHVVGHSDIAPERKQDPLNYPWDDFRKYVQQDLGKQPSAPSLSPDQLEQHLGGRLAGHGNDFIEAGKQFNLNPALLASIAIEESGNGTNDATISRNNPMSTGGGGTRYASLREGIFDAARNLRENYVNKGLKDVASIGRVYAPPGAANDVRRTNHLWPSDVTAIYNRITRPAGTASSETSFNEALPRPATAEEARRLPPGSHFIDPEGNRRMVA